MLKKIFLTFFFLLNIVEYSHASVKDKIINNLIKTENLTFEFKQTINEKTEEGNCIIEYPKKLFCSYNNINKKIMVSNGKSLAIKNQTSNQYYLYPLKRTPLELILDKKLNLFADQLKPMARVSSISLSGDVPRGALQTVVDGVTYAIPLDGLLDKTVERDRLNKEISKIEVEISKIDNKLSNHAFVSNAPEKVVVLQKDRKLSYLNELEKLNLALVNLN